MNTFIHILDLSYRLIFGFMAIIIGGLTLGFISYSLLCKQFRAAIIAILGLIIFIISLSAPAIFLEKLL